MKHLFGPTVYGHDGVWVEVARHRQRFAGAYVLGDIMICMERRPSWLHRTMMELLLGWHWVEAAKPSA